MSDPITVEVTGKDSSSQVPAKVNAAGEMCRELNRRDQMHVGHVHYEPREARPGRFYFVASVKAVPR